MAASRVQKNFSSSRGQKLSAPRQLSVRGRQPKPLKEVNSDCCSPATAKSARALVSTPNSTSVPPCAPAVEFEDSFNGYRHGMSLRDGEPTPMYSGNSDDTSGEGTGDEYVGADEYGAADTGDGHDGLLFSDTNDRRRNIMESTPSRLAVGQFYSTQQPRKTVHQTGRHTCTSTNQDVIALIQSQQASLDKVL